jgi:dTDP-glucose 4,6-dehydratase
MPENIPSRPSKNILILGVAGLLGSHLAERFINEGYNIFGIDNFNSSTLTNLERLKKNKKLTFYVHDIRQGVPKNIPKVDYIVHAGAVETYLGGEDHTLGILEVSSQGVLNLLNRARQDNAAFMLLSTEDVYSGILSSLSLENYYGVNDRDQKRYADHEAKRFAETLTAQYYKNMGLDARIVRVSDVYGPRMNINSGGDLAHLVNKALTDDVITIYGDGLKKIRPLYITDALEGIYRSLIHETSRGKIYHIVNDREMTILECAYAIQKHSKHPLSIQFMPKTSEVPFPLHKMELLQTQQDLSWQPKTQFDQGITQTLEYFHIHMQDHNDVQEESEIIKNAERQKIQTTETKPQLRQAQDNHNPRKRLHIRLPIFKLGLIGASVFIILILLILPLVSLHLDMDALISASAENPLSNKQTIVQKSNSTTQQLDNLTWLFTLLQRRSSFENTKQIVYLLQNVSSERQSLEQYTRSYPQLLHDLANNSLQPSQLDTLVDQLELQSEFMLLTTNSLQDFDQTLLTPSQLEELSLVYSEHTVHSYKALDYYKFASYLKQLLQPSSTAPLQLHLVNNLTVSDDFSTSIFKSTYDVGNTGLSLSQAVSEDNFDFQNGIYFNPLIIAQILEFLPPLQLPQYPQSVDHQNFLSTTSKHQQDSAWWTEFWSALQVQLAINMKNLDFSQAYIYFKSAIKNGNLLLVQRDCADHTCLNIDLQLLEPSESKNLEVAVQTSIKDQKLTHELTVNNLNSKDIPFRYSFAAPASQLQLTDIRYDYLRGLSEVDQQQDSQLSTFSFSETFSAESTETLIMEFAIQTQPQVLEIFVNPVLPLNTHILNFNSELFNSNTHLISNQD